MSKIFTALIEDFRKDHGEYTEPSNIDTTKKLFEWLVFRPQLCLQDVKLQANFFPKEKSWTTFANNRSLTSGKHRVSYRSIGSAYANCISWHFHVSTADACPAAEHRQSCRTDESTFVIMISNKNWYDNRVNVRVYHPRLCNGDDGPFAEHNMTARSYCPVDSSSSLPDPVQLTTKVPGEFFYLPGLFCGVDFKRAYISSPPAHDLEKLLCKQYAHLKISALSKPHTWHSCTVCYTAFIGFKTADGVLHTDVCPGCEVSSAEDCPDEEDVNADEPEYIVPDPEIIRMSNLCTAVRKPKGFVDGEQQWSTPHMLCNFTFNRLVFTEEFAREFDKTPVMWFEISRRAHSSVVSAPCLQHDVHCSNTDFVCFVDS